MRNLSTGDGSSEGCVKIAFAAADRPPSGGKKDARSSRLGRCLPRPKKRLRFAGWRCRFVPSEEPNRKSSVKKRCSQSRVARDAERESCHWKLLDTLAAAIVGPMPLSRKRQTRRRELNHQDSAIPNSCSAAPQSERSFSLRTRSCTLRRRIHRRVMARLSRASAVRW